jgi:hypothetical protein
MMEETFASALKDFCRRRPFVPFFVTLTDGTAFHVTHPEAVYMQKKVAVFRAANRLFRLFDATTVAQLCDELGTSAVAPPVVPQSLPNR